MGEVAADVSVCQKLAGKKGDGARAKKCSKPNDSEKAEQQTPDDAFLSCLRFRFAKLLCISCILLPGKINSIERNNSDSSK